MPQTFLKIVQPAEAGIVREILVKEGDRVREGQVLVRMDTRLQPPTPPSSTRRSSSEGYSCVVSRPSSRASA